MLAPMRVREIVATHDASDGRKSNDELTRLIHFRHKPDEYHASQAPPDVLSEIKTPNVAAAREPTLISSQLLLLPPEIILNLIPMLPYPEYVQFGISYPPFDAVS